MYQIKGEIKLIKSEVQITEKFKKREFVLIENSSQYPQFISFQLTQDRCNLIDSFKEGEQVEVFFNLRGREWVDPKGETKYFISLEVWRLERDQSNNDLPPFEEVQDDTPF